MPDTPAPLAEQTRGFRWWLRAIRRKPVLGVLIVVQFLIAPVLWSLWERPEWLKVLSTFAVVGPIGFIIRDLRLRAARSLESADEAAERTGRRRPVGAGIGADHRCTFTWNSRMGRRLILIGAFWTGATAFGTVVMAWLWHDDRPRTGRDAAIAVAVALAMVIIPVAMTVLSFGGQVRQVRRISADPAERTFVTAIGVDPGTGQWVLERLDDGRRFSARLFGGGHLLVAGDELLAEGTLQKPPASWRRTIPAMFAVTGPFGTWWAQHGDLSEETISGSTVAGVQTTDTPTADHPPGTSGDRTSADLACQGFHSAQIGLVDETGSA